jgi:preprotein translocase subunit SecA
MLQFIAKLFGTKSEKDIKRVMPLVEATKKEGEKLTSLSHDALRAQTTEVQAHIANYLKSIDDKLAALHGKISSQPDLDLTEKESIFNEIDKLELERNKELEKVLIDVLPRAFAIIRETARKMNL